MGIDPFESDDETHRKVGRAKAQRSVDDMHLRSGFDDAIFAPEHSESPYQMLTPQQRLAMKRAERERSDDE